MNGCQSLKSVNLAAFLHIRACGVLYEQPTLQTRAFLEDIEVWLNSPPHGRFDHFSAWLTALPTQYDKKLISHQISLSYYKWVIL